MDYDPYNPLPQLNYNEDQEGQELKSLLDVQTSHMADEDYDKIPNSNKLRKWASLVIFKYSICKKFDATIPYLAMTYFDLYISRRNPILQVMNDIVRDIEILSLCCLTLAWKMRDINFTIPKLQKLQPDLASLKAMVFHKVELHILKAIDWNLRVVTAFSFIPYFVPKCFVSQGFNLRTIHEIIVGIQCHEDIGITVTKMKPSVIAASALIAAAKFLYPMQHCKFVEEEILKEDHDDTVEFASDVIFACNAMKLLIESDVIVKHKSVYEERRIAIRVGGLRMRHKLVAVGELAMERPFNFSLKWTPATGRSELFVIFGGRTRIVWPGKEVSERIAQYIIRNTLESAVRDLCVDRIGDMLFTGIDKLCSVIAN